MRARFRPFRLPAAVLATILFGLAGRPANAATLILREGGGTGITDATFDDTSLLRSATNTVYGNSTIVEFRFPTQGAGNSNTRVALLAVKELFTLLPPVNNDGHTLHITNATLTVTRSVGTAAAQVSVNRMILDWLPYAAGANETVVTWASRDNSTVPETTWPTTDRGTLNAWAEAFYNYLEDPKQDNTFFTLENQAVSPWRADNGPVVFDITELLNDIYTAEANYGFALMVHNGGPGGFDSTVTFRSSEYSTDTTVRPTLAIGYEYVRSASKGTLILIR